MKQLIYHPLIIILISLIAIYFIFSLRASRKKVELSRNNIKTLRQIVYKMETGIEQKSRQLEKSQQPLSKEKIARNELLMKKPGEYVLQLPEINPTQPQKKTKQEKSSWEKWRALLFE